MKVSVRTDHPVRDRVCVQCVSPWAESGSAGSMRPALAGDAAGDQAMVEVAHFAEIVDDGER